MKIVIIGNSVACINAIEAIREKDKISEIKVISDEQNRAYSHPLLPNLVVGDISRSEERFYYRDRKFYERNKVKTILGNKVVKIVPKSKYVRLENDEKITYDKLIITAGGRPFIPDMEGVELDGVHTLTNIKAADKLKKDLENIKKCVVVGGGLIGSKIAEKLAKHGVKVTLVELMRRVLFPVLDDEGAEYIHKELKSMGVKLILGDSVVKMEGDKRVKKAVLSSGKSVDTDAVIVAVGVRPNLELLEESGIETDKGVIVNDYMQTNIDSIYAAGDIVQAYDVVTSQKRPIPILPLAARQGRVAGLNVVGDNVKYKGGFPTNSITIGKIGFISMGIVYSEKLEVLKIKKDGEYRKFIIDDNRLVGMILIGNIERAGMFNWMIQNRFDVSWLKDTFLNSDFGWKYFSKAFRVLRFDRKIK